MTNSLTQCFSFSKMTFSLNLICDVKVFASHKNETIPLLVKNRISWSSCLSTAIKTTTTSPQPTPSKTKSRKVLVVLSRSCFNIQHKRAHTQSVNRRTSKVLLQVQFSIFGFDLWFASLNVRTYMANELAFVPIPRNSKYSLTMSRIG